jgi:putative tryptophan/tyrosine transport system substrate-binding protein
VDDEFEQAHFVRLDRPVIGAIICKNRGNAKDDSDRDDRSQDPVANGFVASLARPGGNVTGLTVQGTDVQGKIMQILKEAVPTISRVGILWVPAEPGREVVAKEAERAARVLGLQPRLVEARDPVELEKGFAVMAREKLDAVQIHPSQLTFAHRIRIAELATKNRLPSIGPPAWYVPAGGLLAYGAKDSDQFDRAAQYVAKILRGMKPADLPVEQPTKFELVVNLKTAKALGLTIPPSVLGRADQVIE